MYRYIKLALLAGWCLTSAQAFAAPLQNGDFGTGSSFSGQRFTSVRRIR